MFRISPQWLRIVNPHSQAAAHTDTDAAPRKCLHALCKQIVQSTGAISQSINLVLTGLLLFHGRSRLNNLIEYFGEVMKVIDEVGAVDVVHIDFSETFGEVPSGRLIHKV